MKRGAPILFLFAFALAATPVLAVHDATALVESLREDDPDSVKLTQTMLIKEGASAVPALTKALGEDNFLLRQRAAEVLGEIGQDALSAIPSLVELLTDAQYGVSDAAGKALVKIGEPAIPALTHAIVSEDAALRREVLPILAQCGPKSIPILTTLLKQSSYVYVRMRSAELLGDFHPATPEIISALTVGLRDVQESVRRSAADSLGEHGAQAVPALETLVSLSADDPDSMVRHKAGKAAERIKQSQAVPPVDSNK